MPPHGNDNCYIAATHHDDHHEDMPSSPLRSPQRLKLDTVLVPHGQDDESLITASTHAVITTTSKMTALHLPMLELEPAHPSHHDNDAASLIPVVPFDDDADDEDEDMEPMSIEDDIAEIAAGAINLSHVRHAPAFALKPQHPNTEAKVYQRIQPKIHHSVSMEAEVLTDGATVSPSPGQQLPLAMSPNSTVAQEAPSSSAPVASTKPPARNGDASPEQSSTLQSPVPRRSALKRASTPPSQEQHRSAVSYFNNGLSQSNIVYGYRKIFTSTTTTTTNSTSQESSTTTNAASRRSVKFTDLHIREYRQVLGDHPCCSSGPPVSLGWDYSPHTSINLEEYESQRIPRVTRRQLRMGCEVRREILLSSSPSSSSQISDGNGEQPYTHGDFRRVERRVQRERYQRGGRMLDRNLGCFFSPPPQSLDGAAGIVTSDSE